MANIFKTKTLVGRTGIFSHEVIAPNLVYNTGYQNIDGLKDFTIRPTVGTIPVLLSGDIPYVQTNSYFYVDATRTDSYIENGNILYPYKTLSGAYNAAKNIAYFHNPTYITLLSPIAENLTIDKGYINLVGNNTNKNDPIRITGSLVFAATGIGSTITDNNFSIAGLGITATSNNKCILFSGNNPQRLFIQDCWLIAKDNGTCLYLNNTNTTSRLQGDILKLSPEEVNTTAIDIVSGTSSISFAETSSSASVLAYVRNNSTLNISNSQIETAGAKAFQVENTARLTLLNSVLINTANPSTGIFLKDAFSTAVVVGSAISVPANANSYAINGVANSYLFYKNLYFSIDAIGGSTESKIGNNVNKNLINSYDPVVYSIGDQTISGVKTFDVFPIVSGNKLITGVDLNAYATVANLFATGSNLDNKINSLSGVAVLTFGDQNISGNKNFLNNISVSGTGVFNAIDLNNIDTLNLSGVDISITNGNVSLTNRPNVNGTGVVLSGELNSTGIFLNNKINSLSGYVNSQDLIFSGQIASTGSNLTNSINSLSGASVLLYGNQTISGIKTFAENAVFGDPSQGDFLVISGNTFTIYGSGNFINGLFVSGVPVLTGVDLSSYATVSNLFSTGSILNNKINSLSGVSVLTFGNQNISGIKTFVNTGVFGTSNFNYIPLTSNPLSVVGSGNTFVQLNIQNFAIGDAASSDLVLTSNAGTDDSFYLDLGINNSGYSQAAYNIGNSGDGYLYVHGGNLTIGTQSPNRTIKFHTDGTTSVNQIAEINSTGYFSPNKSVIALSGIFGKNNTVSLTEGAFIGGGCNNSISRSTCSPSNSSILGGICNTISNYANNSFIGGGTGNSIAANCFGFIGGGNGNNIAGVVCNGGFDYNSILNGFNNLICATAQNNAIIHGDNNTILGRFSSIVGGTFNVICLNAIHSSIVGGSYNVISGAGHHNSILNGFNNSAGLGGSTSHSIIGNGNFNKIFGAAQCDASQHNAILNGSTNEIGSRTTVGKYATILNGSLNTISGNINGASCANVILFPTIIGGTQNTIMSDFSTILGGRFNSVIHNGSTIISDGSSRVKRSIGNCTLLIDFCCGTSFGNQALFDVTPQILTVNSNFNITTGYNSRMILVNSAAAPVTGFLTIGQVSGFNASLMQIGAGQIQITGSGIGVTFNSYNNQYKSAGIYSTISVLHTGNNGYIMYGNTA